MTATLAQAGRSKSSATGHSLKVFRLLVP